MQPIVLNGHESLIIIYRGVGSQLIRFSTATAILILLSLLMSLSGCFMEDDSKMRIKKGEFKNVALEIVKVFEISIKYVGFPFSEREKIDAFYESKFDEEGERIKKLIMNVEYNFFGSTNFKDRNDPKNKVLFEKLSSDIKEIREDLENYPDNNT